MKFTYPSDARPVDGYTIRRGIHRGGYGEVYYAVSDAGKEVALKLLTHDLETELRGIRQCLNLKHPNLVSLFDVKTDSDGEHWLVMEYVHGSNLEDVLTAFPQGLPLGEVRDWLAGLVEGVEFLHDRGLIHRDLKPANIYRENGVVKIGDVGLSKRLDGARGQHTESIGTVYYMAPEITHGQYGPQIDVYSLGIILYEMLTGKLPFNGETSGEILMKQLSAAPDLAAVAPNLRPMLARALEKDPKQRTPSARQLGIEFEQALSPTAIPESHFVKGATRPVPVTVEAARKETDRKRDTAARRPVSPPPVAVRRSADREPVVFEKSNRRFVWGLAAMVIIALCIPWQRMSWGDAGETAGILGFYGGIVLLMLWASGRWKPASNTLFSRLSGSPPAPMQFADWTGSLALGSLAAIIISSALLFMPLEYIHGPWQMRKPEAVVFFTAVSVLGVWAVIGLKWLAQRTPWVGQHPRLMHASAGLLLGSIACLLDDFLMFDYNTLRMRGWGNAIFDHLGANPLLDGRQPTWFGYAVVFAGLFFLLGRKFQKLQAPQRAARWMMRYPFIAALFAFGLVHLFAFPQLPAVLWAATIVSAVQLAAPWQPSK